MIECKEGALSDRIAFGLLCLKFVSWTEGDVVGRATLHVSKIHYSAEDECWKAVWLNPLLGQHVFPPAVAGPTACQYCQIYATRTQFPAPDAADVTA